MTPRSISISIFSLAALFTLGTSAFADTLSGRIVDPNGVGVPGVNIDIESLTGPDPIVQGDTTNALGFFNATLPAGLYRVIFIPPAPPTTTLLTRVFDDQVIVGTIDIGTVFLEQGVSLAGRLVDSTGTPVVGVDLDVVDETIGEDMFVVGDNSDVLGQFNLAVRHEISLQIDPSTIDPLLPPLAPREQRLSLTGNTSLGDIVLAPGFDFSGVLLDASGLPVVGADIDLEDPVIGQDIYTPGDNTNAFGLFSFVAPAGVYDVEICPPSGLLLVSLGMENLVLSGDFNTGILTLQPGALLSGTVLDCMGAPVVNVDVDAENSATGKSIFLCGDNTDATGSYSVVVPTATINVTFSSQILGMTQETGVVVSGNTIVNGTLPCCPAGSVSVRNGSGTNPLVFTSLVTPTIGSNWSAQVDASGYAPGFVLVVGRSGSLDPLPTVLGELLIHPGSAFLFSAAIAHAGGPAVLSSPIPNRHSICGRPVHAQAILTGSPGPVFTNALVLTAGS